MLQTSAPANRYSSPPSLSRFFAAIPLLFVFMPIAHAFDPLSDIPDSSYVTDGPVNAIVRSDSTVYIAGQFSRIGPRTGPGIEVALDGSQPAGQPQISGRGASLGFGSVTGLRAVVDDGAGGWYVSGLFDHVGGLPRSNLAHILANRTVDANFAPTVDGAITSLALSGTTLYVGGLFTTISGEARNNIAALSTIDGSATPFNPNADKAVTALALSGDNATLYVGGSSFTSIGGQARNGLAAIDTVSGTANGSFLPLLARTSATAASVDSIVLGGSTIYVAGNFDNVGGVPRRTLAALDLVDGSLVTAFAPAPTSASGCAACASIVSISLSGNTLFVGGSFGKIGGQLRKNLAGLDVATASPPPLTRRRAQTCRL